MVLQDLYGKIIDQSSSGALSLAHPLTTVQVSRVDDSSLLKPKFSLAQEHRFPFSLLNSRDVF